MGAPTVPGGHNKDKRCIELFARRIDLRHPGPHGSGRCGSPNPRHEEPGSRARASGRRSQHRCEVPEIPSRPITDERDHRRARVGIHLTLRTLTCAEGASSPSAQLYPHRPAGRNGSPTLFAVAQFEVWQSAILVFGRRTPSSSSSAATSSLDSRQHSPCHHSWCCSPPF
jgi:hypothetical protein